MIEILYPNVYLSAKARIAQKAVELLAEEPAGTAFGCPPKRLPSADVAIKRLRDSIDFLCEYSIDRGYGFRFALEAKPNEPRGDIFMSTTAAYLALIPTLSHPDMVGVNPEVAHEQMAGFNFMHAIAQAWEAGKLFHIDLNDQMPGRCDQDFRFGAANPRAAFFIVKFLEDAGYDGPRHFDLSHGRLLRRN